MARAEYQALKEDGPKYFAKDGVLTADGKSELHSVQEPNSNHNNYEYMSINVFASFVHSLSDLIVMIGVFIAAVIIKIRVRLKVVRQRVSKSIFSQKIIMTNKIKLNLMQCKIKYKWHYKLFIYCTCEYQSHEIIFSFVFQKSLQPFIVY